jgi:hypothetical protein
MDGKRMVNTYCVMGVDSPFSGCSPPLLRTKSFCSAPEVSSAQKILNKKKCCPDVPVRAGQAPFRTALKDGVCTIFCKPLVAG